MESAILRAARPVLGARHLDLDELASPPRRRAPPACARSRITSVSAALKPPAADRRTSSRALPRSGARRWRTAGSVSAVEVSPSTVMQLKVVVDVPRRASPATPAGAMAASVKRKTQHGRHVRRDHAGALGEAVDGHRRRRRSWPPRGELWVGVGGHDGARGRSPTLRRQPLRKPPSRPANLPGVQRLADHPGRGDDRPRSAGNRRPWRRRPPSASTASRPRLPVKALALPELTTSARAVPFCRLSCTTTGADAAFDRVSTPADRGAGLDEGNHQVRAALVADTGGARREAHPVNHRHVRQRLRREWRDLGHLGPRPSSGDCL